VAANKKDPYGWLTVADLQVVARAHHIHVREGAEREEILALLRRSDAHPSGQPSEPQQHKSTPSALPERSGWWSSMSVSVLRTLARDHGLDVAAGMHRRELVELLVEHDVPRPPSTTSGRRRPSR
jgi:hypothetical protein